MSILLSGGFKPPFGKLRMKKLVNFAPNWTTISLDQWEQLQPVNTQLVAQDPEGSSLTYSVAPGFSLPSGVTLSSSGLLSGKPTVSGIRAFSIRVSDSKGAFSDQSFSVSIKDAPVVNGSWVARGSNTITNNGLTVATSTNVPDQMMQFYKPIFGGKHYWEIKIDPVMADPLQVWPGIVQANMPTSTNAASFAGKAIFWQTNSNVIWTLGATKSIGSSAENIQAGQWLMVAFDASAGKIWFGWNGQWIGGASAAQIVSGTNPHATVSVGAMPGPYLPMLYSTGNAPVIKATMNYGQVAYNFTPPSGFGSNAEPIDGIAWVPAIGSTIYDDNGFVVQSGNKVRVSSLESPGYGTAWANRSVAAGKWYWEIQLDEAGTTRIAGIARPGLLNTQCPGYQGDYLYSYAVNSDNGQLVAGNGQSLGVKIAPIESYQNYNRIGFALDMDQKCMWIRGSDGKWNGAATVLADPSYPAVTGIPDGAWYPVVGDGDNSARMYSIFSSASDCSLPAPTGFSYFKS